MATHEGSYGTVALAFGRHFAGRIDLLTHERYKTMPPINGVSPLSAVAPRPRNAEELLGLERSTPRAELDIKKNLAHKLASSGADYLLVDNSAALLWLLKESGTWFSIDRSDRSSLMDLLWNEDENRARQQAVRPAQGLDRGLRKLYDAFVDVCLAHFSPDRIILVRSHLSRFWVDADGVIGVTDAKRLEAEFLDSLDRRFAERTGCQVSEAALGGFPTEGRWQKLGHHFRRRLEADALRIMEQSPSAQGEWTTGCGVADLVADAAAHGQVPSLSAVRDRLSAKMPIWEDFLALGFLAQRHEEADPSEVRALVSLAVSWEQSPVQAETRARFQRSFEALNSYDGNLVGAVGADVWAPQVAIAGSPTAAIRFLADGTVTVEVSPDPGVGTDDELASVPLAQVRAALRSWRFFLERGRRRLTGPVTVVADAAALADSCAYVDWEDALAQENLVLREDGTTDVSAPPAAPGARTDLSFMFDPSSRIGTVGGGLMDQVTHIALYEKLCAPDGLTAYYDDFRYTWWRSHNGFEASRIAPELEKRRITRLVSHALVERFREEVTSTGFLPWVYNQSRAWRALGLRDLVIVARNDHNSRRLLEQQPEFATLIYTAPQQLGGFIHTPPSPETVFTTQQRIGVGGPSAPYLRGTFDLSRIDGGRMPEKVRATAQALSDKPHIALHIRRGDYLNAHFDKKGWHASSEPYREAIAMLRDEGLLEGDARIAVFSDDLEFVRQNPEEYGLADLANPPLFVEGNSHFESIYDAYLMSLCPTIVGAVGNFSATSSLLAQGPSSYIRARPMGVKRLWSL